MKHDELRSIAHNVADSLASGCGLMIGVYMIDVFGEVAKSPSGFIEIDFLNGTTSGGQVSPALSDALRLYAAALPALCARHGTSLQAFEELTVRYYFEYGSRRFVVKVKDETGRSSVTEYGGLPGQRVKQIDEHGRLRPKYVSRTGPP
jgi:hypothetical protein